MSPKSLGLLVLIVIACLVSPTFGAVVVAGITLLWQLFAICILACGLICLLCGLLFGRIRVKSAGRTYEY